MWNEFVKFINNYQSDICLTISLIVLVVFIVRAITKLIIGYKRGTFFTPFNLIFVGVIISSIVLFIPLCNVFADDTPGFVRSLDTIMNSLHNTMKLFVVDAGIDVVFSPDTFDLLIETSSSFVNWAYPSLMMLLLIVAPILTFGFVLSFFENVFARHRYNIAHFCDNAYVFSELNEKSVTLAEDLHRNDAKKRIMVFTNVLQNDEHSFELVERAKEIGAICFKNDIVSVDFSFHSKKKQLNFFLIGEDKTKNISHALKIIEKFKHRELTNLYVFSTKMESEFLLSNAFGDPKAEGGLSKIKIRRVNEVRSLVNRLLYEEGYEKIFCTAKPDDGVKRINALIIGMGLHGVEMLKSLPWFCQMDGYLANITAVDIDKNAESKFTSACPELMAFSGKINITGETRYTINVHSGVDVDTFEFDNLISTLSNTTYAFVALGDDEKNISTAVKLRSIFEKMGCKSVIQTVIYDSERKEALKDVKNFKGIPYDIDFVGDIKSSYSEKVILASDIENDALGRHLKYGKDTEYLFWKYDYNYKSSIASAIHRKMKLLCGIPGVEKTPDNRPEDERQSLRILEHCRWNAYMRSEGYIYGGTIEKSGRNDLAKTHNCLVPFDELPPEEQQKDDD